MRSVKILIVANNCKWSTWPEKILELKKWYSRRIHLSIDLVHTELEDIPMADMTNAEGKTYRGVEAGWYSKNVAPLGIEYDMVMFVMNLRQWGARVGARGWRTDADSGPIKLQVSADEDENVYYPQFGNLPAFYQFARHEIMHALYMLNIDQSKGDRTHHFWDLGDFESALNDIEIGNNRIVVGDVWGFISRFFALIKNNRTEKWAKAIQEFEGYAEGTRSYRNNNPGNIKYTGYTRSLGALGQDSGGFAVFGTYEQGFEALKRFLADAKAGNLISYKPSMTLAKFFSVYAPSSDHNDPDTYAAFVAKRIGVSSDELISNL